MRYQSGLGSGIICGMSRALEQRMRRTAERRGFTLKKSPRRDHLATDYGWYILKAGQQLAHFHDIEDIERWLQRATVTSP